MRRGIRGILGEDDMKREYDYSFLARVRGLWDAEHNAMSRGSCGLIITLEGSATGTCHAILRAAGIKHREE
ncbi:MAG TPA: hypothetical protein VFX10_03580 [Nitrospira sp.]|nr:hypothetical protein [Nitrospira sp.]